jgi:hypothetical protein
MSNVPAAASSGGALAALSNLKGAIQNVKQSVVIAGGDPILRLGRDGVWVYGADNTEVEEGSQWAINPLSLRHGQVCWKVIPQGSKEKPELFGKHSVPATQPKPNPGQAFDSAGNSVDHGQHPWADFVGVDIACISGEDKGVQVTYEPSSTGGLRALDGYMTALAAQLEKDDKKPVAIVELDSDHYDHKQYGKTYVPVLKIVDWVALDETVAPAAEPADEPEVKTETADEAAPRGRRGASANQNSTASQEAPGNAPEAEANQGGERRRRRRG